MRKRGYYEYNPVIYPRILCVAIGMNLEDANLSYWLDILMYQQGSFGHW